MNEDIIKEKLISLFSINSFKFLLDKNKTEYNKQLFIDISLYKYNLLNSTNKTFLEIYKDSFKYFKLYTCPNKNINKLFKNDCVQYFNEYFCRNILNYTDEQIMIRYKDYESTKERMFYRIELYLYGWDFYQIEKYINKKFNIINETIDIKIDEEIFKVLYNNILFIKNIKIDKKYNRHQGRPSLPESLKEYNKNKNKEKMKKIMTDKYTILNKLQNNLFSSDEIKYIKDILSVNIKEDTIHSSIIEKLSNLSTT